MIAEYADKMQNTARRRLMPVPGHLSRKEECQTDFPRDNPQTSSYPLRAAWPPDIGFIPTSVLPVLLLQDVEPDGEADDQPLDDELVERGDAEQAHAVVQNPYDQRADDRAADGAGAAREAGAADHHGGDGVKLEHVAEVGGSAVQSGGQQNARQRREQRNHHIDDDFRRVDVDARQACGLFVAAERVEPPAEAGMAENENRKSGSRQQKAPDGEAGAFV